MVKNLSIELIKNLITENIELKKQITEIKKRINDNKELIKAKTMLKNSLKTTENKKAIQTY